jgi:aldose 1-epimerase
MSPSVNRFPYGTTPGGEKIERWHLDNGDGVTADVLSYGATLHRFDASTPLTLSHPDYPYSGTVVGRYANRIAGGKFGLDGVTYTLPVNDRGHTLHGGPGGFSDQLWHAEPVLSQQDAAVQLTLTSPHLDMGFPGQLAVSVTYSLDAAGTLAIGYLATADRATVVNLSHHAYFNLAGGGDILGHMLQVEADAYLPVDPTGIPLGPALPVSGTAFDFTVPRPAGSFLAISDSQLLAAGGYDHCFVLRPAEGALRRAAGLTAPGSGRALEVWTTEPGLQVYTGNKLPGPLRHTGICLETQHFPDSPNRPGYPSTVLRPGQEFVSRTELRLPGWR